MYVFSLRYSSQDVPTTLVGLEKWLQELWREKEAALANFYLEGQQPFLAAQAGQWLPRRALPLQYLSLAAWLFFLRWAMFDFLLSWSGLAWVALVSGSMFLVSKYTPGLQEAEVGLKRHGLVSGLWKLLASLSSSSAKKDQ